MKVATKTMRVLAAAAALSACGGGADDADDTFGTSATAGEDAAAAARHRPPGGPLRGDCATLAARLTAPGAMFTLSESVPGGALKLAGADLPAHCRLTGRMHERVSPVDGKTYSIGFEMRLPLDWNGRYFYQANGGIDGSVVTATGNTSGGGPLTSALLQGFAVISSDAGHSAAQNPTFGIDPQARLDFGYQAVGKLTPMAKGVIRAAYGKSPSYSYIGGCSNGGRHALVAAARYANDYDGFLVGAPGFNLPQAAVANIYGAQQYAPFAVPGATVPAGPFAGLPDLSGAFTVAERQLVSNKVLERCDLLDGLADGIVQKVAACQRVFSLQNHVPTCSGARDGTCLSAAQKEAIGNIFEGARDSTGRPIYASFPYDAGLAAGGIAFWEFNAPLVLDSGAVAFIFGTPPANPATFVPPLFALTSNIDALAASIFATDALYTQASMSFMTPPDPTNLRTLQRTGGRMIVYHGVSDPIFSIDDTTRWFRRLNRHDASHRPFLAHDRDREDDDDRDAAHVQGGAFGGHGARGFARLFHVPGMNHCSGGPATDQFDLLTPLVQWVEGGKAPERVVATARGTGNAGGINPELPVGWTASRTRPLCAWPRVAVYKGGDVERAESFRCE